MTTSLVTGATGFVGSVLAAKLKNRGDEIIALGRHPSDGPWDRFVAADLAHDLPPDALDGVDHVFHLAARVHQVLEHEQHLDAYMKVNMEGTLRLADAAIASGAKSFVFMSSAQAVDASSPGAITEEADDPPDTPYGLSKRAAEKGLLERAAASRMRACALRPSLVYGPGCKANLLRMIEAIDHRRFPPLPDVGNKRSLVHVTDLADAALLASDHPRAAGEIYFVTDGRAYSTRQMYEALTSGLGRKIPRAHVPLWLLRLLARTGDGIGRLRGRPFVFDSAALQKLTGSAWYDSSKIQTHLGFTPTHTFEESVEEMVAAYRGNQPSVIH